VAAYLLREQGYEVIVGFMKNYTEPDNPHCHTREDRNMALRVADHLGLDTFVITDFRTEYQERIIDYIYSEYRAGRTPNPDVLCNSLVKFDLFLEKALSLGCDGVAMGHYARVKCVNDQYQLLRGVDLTKDQSYFLSQLNQHQLAHAYFPLGAMTKAKVRDLATQIGLPNAERPDSQGLCFIGPVSMGDFLSHVYGDEPGDVLDVDGQVIGSHDGAYRYTIGQRHGFRTPMRAYVVATDVTANTITVVFDREHLLLTSHSFGVSDRHRIGDASPLPYHTGVKIRYRQSEPIRAQLV
jgi:tRNA-specific 2-thiouridylase